MNVIDLTLLHCHTRSINNNLCFGGVWLNTSEISCVERFKTREFFFCPLQKKFKVIVLYSNVWICAVTRQFYPIFIGFLKMILSKNENE